MRRTQLYLDDDLWSALHAQARSQRTTISELARRAIRERYLGELDQRRNAMQAFVGLRKDSLERESSEAVVRRLRRSTRMDRLQRK